MQFLHERPLRLWPVALEFPADGSMMSVDPSSNLAQAEPSTVQMADDISLLLSKMCIGHGRLLLGVRSVVLPTLPEILSCPVLMLSGAL
jgi:hypothetical protein